MIFIDCIRKDGWFFYIRRESFGKTDRWYMKRAEKIKVLEIYLIREPENYRDSFKTDIYLFFNEDFTDGNPLLAFLDSFNERSEIENWVDLVTSQIVLKFDEEVESIGDFIGEYLHIK